MILVADVGGTRTRLALARREGQVWVLSRLQITATPADLPALVAQYCREKGELPIAAFGCAAAGPPGNDGRIQLTNAEALLDPAALALAARTRVVTLVNDFAAVAQAIPTLTPAQLRLIGGGASQPGRPCLVIGAGTGLGVATLVPTNPWTVLPGEGGHMELAAHDDEQAEILQRLRRTQGRVPAESVLSGPGLERLYRAVATGEPLAAPVIAARAWDGEPAAVRTIRLFTRWLGHYSGDLALALGAGGGVYIAGGIVPGWGEHFSVAEFRSGFEDNPGYGGWLRTIPCFIVTHPQPGLVGAAELAAQALSRERAGSSVRG
jgi:glucokinase